MVQHKPPSHEIVAQKELSCSLTIRPNRSLCILPFLQKRNSS
jgi:hypothetical protein